MSQRFHVDKDISVAETLPADFYLNDAYFEESREKIFRKSWHWLGHDTTLPFSGSVRPVTLYPTYMDEPLLLVRDAKDDISCLSNVCTHRANLVCQNPGKLSELRCDYHGRRFELNGKFKSMPEFKEAKNFPRACDDLKTFPVEKLGPYLFGGLNPSFEMKEVLDFVRQYVGFMPLDQYAFREDLSKDYLVNAHWALYCDNYLEGFHIPFVHEDLNKLLDYGKYCTVLSEYANLQVGYASGGEEIFDLPAGHPNHGEEIAAFYFWLFPNVMLNFYTWGLSVNVVNPISKNKTKVSFLTYIYDETKYVSGADALMDKVEREDEYVVESVQKGLNSGHYQTGRFSPKREEGVHHFHRLLAEFMG